MEGSMAKKRSKKNTMSLIVNIVIIALAVLTICTLFMPVFKKWIVPGGVQTWQANGADVFTAAFAGEASIDMSAGAFALYGLKAAEDTAFVATVGYWAYMLLVLVSAAVVVFAILNILGLRFKLVNTILGSALVVLAIVTFIFALICAGKLTAVTTTVAGKTGLKCAAKIGMYFACLGGLVCGGATVYQTRR